MRLILLNICLTAIALCLFKMLVPENALKKQVDFLVSCFFLTTLVFFFASGKSDLADYFSEQGGVDLLEGGFKYADFEAEYSAAQRKAVAAQMQSSLMKILAEQNIYPKEIFTVVNISDKYSISINEIRLVFSKDDSENLQENSEEDLKKKSLEILKQAIHIVQKEVGEDILVTGEFK